MPTGSQGSDVRGSAEGGRRHGKQEVYSHIRAAESVRWGKRPHQESLPGPSDSSEIQENLQPRRKAGSALLEPGDTLFYIGVIFGVDAAGDRPRARVCGVNALSIELPMTLKGQKPGGLLLWWW